MSLRVRTGVSSLALVAALAGWPLAALAQSTAVVADVGNALALGTSVTTAGTVLTIDGGARAGGNLFHSFTTFSLGAGDTARWTRSAGDGASVSNVISRVTGGQVSQISGTLDSTALPNASFYFVNPAGIVLGAGAQVNVPAAAYFSTAAQVRFADGGSFAVAAPDGSTLSVASPESFGFVGGQGAISITGAGATLAQASTALSFSGSDVSFVNDNLSAANRTVVRGLDLIGVGEGAHTVRLSDPLAASATGAVTVRNSAFVITSGDTPAGAFRIGGGQVELGAVSLISDTGGAARGGDIRVVADTLRISGASQIGTSARASGDAGDLSLTARDLSVDGGTLFSVTTTGAAGGRIALSADTLAVRGFATLASTNSAGGPGGDIVFTAKSLLIEDAFVVSSTLGGGRGGHVAVSAPSMQLFNANLFATSLGDGRPGDVSISGGAIEISGGSYGSSPGARSDSGGLNLTATSSLSVLGASFSASSASDNGAGAIIIRSPEVLLVQARFQADNFGAGGAGMVSIEADTLVFDETNIRVEANGAPGARLGLVRLKATGDLRLTNSIVTSNTNGQADGGIVEIAGRDVRFEDSRVQSDTIGLAEGAAGRVAVKADTLLVRNGLISSSSNSLGTGGDVVLEARTITLDTSAGIRSDASDQGDAGQVTVKAGAVSVLEGASITSRAQGGTGNAGTVSIDADSLTVVDGRISSGTTGQGDAGVVSIRAGQLLLDAERRDQTFITSETLGAGDAGGIFIDARSIVIRNGASIASDTFDTGHAGEVTLRTDSLTVQDGGFVSSDSFGDGDSGNVNITAAKLLVQGNGSDLTFISSDALGAGKAGAVTLDAKSLSVTGGGFISSDTYTSGDGGDITIRSDTISLRDFGNIRSRTLSEGQAGNIRIATGTLDLAGGGAISSEATETSFGNAGFIGIVADTVTLAKDSLISTASRGEGNAGQVGLVAKTLTVESALISSSAEQGARGASGALRIEAGTLVVRGGGSISTVSNNILPAGRVEIVAGALTVDGLRSLVSSENLAGNAAMGNPSGDRGDAGAVSIVTDGLTVANGGRITTNSFAGAAGEINIRIDRPGLLVLKGDKAPGVIQTSSGAGTGGKITIADPLAIISNGGSIQALGQQRGANVVIQSRYFINSTDRANTVEVDGDIQLQTGLYDVSSGTVSRDLSVLDASRVLRGQCPAARSTGAVSQLITRPVGPYVREPGGSPTPAPGARTAGPGACP